MFDDFQEDKMKPDEVGETPPNSQGNDQSVEESGQDGLNRLFADLVEGQKKGDIGEPDAPQQIGRAHV